MIKKSEVFLFKNLIVKTKKSQIKNKEIKGDRKKFITSKTSYKTLKFPTDCINKPE